MSYLFATIVANVKMLLDIAGLESVREYRKKIKKYKIKSVKNRLIYKSILKGKNEYTWGGGVLILALKNCFAKVQKVCLC